MSTNKIINAIGLFIVILCASTASLAAGGEEKNIAAVRRFTMKSWQRQPESH
jgi:hypothetical protein